MSGRSIGTAIGFVVGSYFGMGSLGATVGGMIGGAIDPDKVQGAVIGDLPVQRSLTGNVQPVVLGTSLVDQCLIMWSSADRIVKEKEQQGKGGGPVVVNQVLYKDYRIRVCRSSAADGSQVEGFPMIFEDGRLVYDTRPSPRISAADSAKWAENVRFYYGGPTQEPDPTEEAALGVGNASAHRQIASFVKVNQKMTDFGNRVPTYEVVVSRCGVEGGGGSEGFPTFLLVTGYAKTTGGPVFAVALATPTPSFTGINTSTGADIGGGVPAYYDGTWAAVANDAVRYSTDDRATWQTGTINSLNSPRQFMGGHSGWMANEAEYTPGYTGHVCTTSLPTALTETLFTGTYSNGITNASSAISVAKRSYYVDGYYYRNFQRDLFRCDTPNGTYLPMWDTFKNAAAGIDNNGTNAIVEFTDLCKFGDDFYSVIVRGFTSTHGQLVRSINGIDDWAAAEVLVDTTGGVHAPKQICKCGDYLVALADGGGVWTSANGWASWVDNGLTTGGFSGARKIAYANGRIYVIDDYDKCVVSSDGGLTWSVPITMPIASAVGIVAGVHTIAPGSLPIPDAPGYYVDPVTGETDGPSLGESSLCGTTLAEVVRYICNRGQLDDAELYLTELENIPVRGVTLQSPGTCKDELDPLRQAHFFDPADFDSKLRFRLRGTVDVDMVINPDDLVFTEDEEEQNRILGQEVDLSRKHALNYLSLDLDYLRHPAPHEFTTLDPSVVGTSDATINEVFWHDEAMRISAIQHELLRMGNEGYRKFGLPMEYLSLVGGSLVTLNGRRGRIDGQSIDLNAIWFDPVPYDRARAYEANVVAPVLTPPTGPGTTIKGPTDSTLLNVPVLRDNDDKPGIYWAPRGYPDTAWSGAVLQVLRDGQWLQLDSTTKACNTGTLLADLPAYDGVVDETNTLQIRLSGEMDSITFAQFLNEGNPLAIQYDDGKAEILQAQFVTEVTPGVYDCTRLIRGRLDTVNGPHVAGAKVVFLNNDLRFIQLRKDDIGKTLSFRAVSNGTDPSLATTQTITLTTMESQREWQPWNVTATKDDDCQWLVDWIQRPRLGTDANPIQSQWWIGDRIDFVLDGITKSRMTRERPFLYTTAMQNEDFGGVHCPGYGITVVAVNEYTGGDGAGGTGTGNPGGGVPIPPSTSPDGSAGSTALGPNGGYADNNPPPIPPPTTLGSNVITDPTNIANWRDTSGGPLNPIYWNMVGGELHYAGGGNTTARYQPALVRMPVQPISRYTITFSATITTALGKKAAIGVGLEAAVFAEYPTPTPVTVVYDVARTFLSVNGSGFVDFTSAPEFHVADADGVAGGEAWVSSPDFQIDAVPVPVTQEYPAHLDFDTGVADWVAWPPDPGGYFGFSASGGVVTFTSTVDSAIIRNVYCKTPLTLPDALGKYIGVGGEVCSNSTKTISGITWGGASFGIIIVKVATGDIVATFGGPYQRGDFTEREFWFRQHVNSPGVYSIHAAILVRVEVGKFVKVRNMWTKTTDSVLTP